MRLHSLFGGGPHAKPSDSRRRLLRADGRRRRRFRRAACAIQLDWRLFRRQRRPWLGQREDELQLFVDPGAGAARFRGRLRPRRPAQCDRRHRRPKRHRRRIFARQPRRLVQHVRRVGRPVRLQLPDAADGHRLRGRSRLGRRRAFDQFRRAAEYGISPMSATRAPGCNGWAPRACAPATPSTAR